MAPCQKDNRTTAGERPQISDFTQLFMPHCSSGKAPPPDPPRRVGQLSSDENVPIAGSPLRRSRIHALWRTANAARAEQPAGLQSSDPQPSEPWQPLVIMIFRVKYQNGAMSEFLAGAAGTTSPARPANWSSAPSTKRAPNDRAIVYADTDRDHRADFPIELVGLIGVTKADCRGDGKAPPGKPDGV